MSFLSLTSSPCQTQFTYSTEDSYENNIENVPLSFLQRKSTVNHFTTKKESDSEIMLSKHTVTRIKKPLHEIKVDDLKNRINNEQNVFKFQNLSFADILNNSIKEKKQCDKEERASRKLNKIKQMKRQRILYNYNTYTNNSNTIMMLD